MHDMSTWVGEGRIKNREDVVDGLKNAPQALIGPLARREFRQTFGAIDTRQQRKPN
jgi:NADPH-dependent curcumin reductase